jgi:hypothetical protein
MQIVMMMLLMEMLMERPPTPRRSGDEDGVNFPPHRRLRFCRICPLSD